MKLKIFIFIKRLFDIILSLTSLFCCFPIFMVICILIKLDSRGPIFMKDKRIGKDGAPFNLLIFRTRDIDTSKITMIGHILQKLRLDEIPQLINILKGEMSFIGPRPARQFEVEHYKDIEKERLICRPGITGLAQVYSHGLSNETFDNRIKLDIEYVINRSISLDLKILLLTIKVVLFGNKQ
jgi:undecaprenyl phosphate N,N'-diacetylbacillosamine 1-phosphate transferase